MTDTETPEGAHLYLLAIAAHMPSVPDEGTDAWLMGERLIAPNGAGIPDLTERGRAWVDMILATPLPVQVAAWGDPRGAAPAVATVYAPQQQRPAAAPAPVQQSIVAGALPPGFMENVFLDVPPGKYPPGMDMRTELEIVRRSGKRLKNYAIAIIWGHLNKPEDVMGYRFLEADSLANPN